MMEQLPLLAPDPARAARTLARCHHALARRRQRLDFRRRARAQSAVIERALLAAAAALYLVAAARDVWQVFSRS